MTYDRYGEPIADTVDVHECDGGWIDRDADHPRPCLVCKPNLAPGRRRYRAGLDDHPARQQPEESTP